MKWVDTGQVKNRNRLKLDVVQLCETLMIWLSHQDGLVHQLAFELITAYHQHQQRISASAA